MSTPGEVLLDVNSRLTQLESTLQSLNPLFTILNGAHDALNALINSGVIGRVAALETYAANIPNNEETAKRTSESAVAILRPKLTDEFSLFRSEISAELTTIRTSIDTFRRDATANLATKADLKI